MAELIWTAKAVEQIEEIGLFIEKDSPFQARRVVTGSLLGRDPE